MNKIKKICASALAFAASVPVAIAAGETPIIDQQMSEAASGAVNQLKTDLSSWVTTVLPYLLGIVGAFLVFWLIKFAIRLVKSYSNTAKA